MMADITYNHFGEIADELHGILSQVVRKTAFDGQANIQAKIRENGQVDTGFMVNSVYTVTDESSNYQGGEKALPQVEQPTDDLTAYVAVGAEYGAAQNYGTRYLPPRPFFEPGMEATRASFDAAMAAIAKKLGG